MQSYLEEEENDWTPLKKKNLSVINTQKMLEATGRNEINLSKRRDRENKRTGSWDTPTLRCQMERRSQERRQKERGGENKENMMSPRGNNISRRSK